jgi:GIY-YIG catalytic domain
MAIAEQGHPSFPWTRESIIRNAPNRSGVYALFKPTAWIYIGESGDIQTRLLQHFNGDDPCITREQPTGFQYELVTADRRLARQNQLIVALNWPPCNARLG